MADSVGRRIVVFGPSGSGKSTLARNIGERLALPVIELDALFHRPNWEETPVDEFRAKVLGALDGHSDGWVCDGNYGKVRDITLSRADTAVRLRLPFRVVYWRLFRRTVTRAWTKESLWGTNHESWRLSFLSRDSILLWGLTHWRAHHRGIDHALATIPHRANVIDLRSSGEVDRFLERLKERSVA